MDEDQVLEAFKKNRDDGLPEDRPEGLDDAVLELQTRAFILGAENAAQPDGLQIKLAAAEISGLLSQLIATGEVSIRIAAE